jgi:hypothetical protein
VHHYCRNIHGKINCCHKEPSRKYHFQTSDISIYAILKKSVKNCNKSFETRAEIFHAGMKANWDTGGVRILLGDNTGCAAITLWPIAFECSGVRISDGVPIL